MLGISTGGPQALKYLIPQLPADFPVPLVMVMHMPVGYTEMYAQRLDEISQLKVSEAREGDIVKPGVVLLAPAGRHLTLRRQANGDGRHAPGRPPLRRPAPPVGRRAVSIGGGAFRQPHAGRRDDGHGVGWKTGRGMDKIARRPGIYRSRRVLRRLRYAAGRLLKRA